MKDSEILALIRSEITSLRNASTIAKTANSRSLDNYFKVESRSTEEGEVVDETTLGKIPKFIKYELDKYFENDTDNEKYGTFVILLNDNHKEIIDKLEVLENKLDTLDNIVQTLSSLTDKVDSIQSDVTELLESQTS